MTCKFQPFCIDSKVTINHISSLLGKIYRITTFKTFI